MKLHRKYSLTALLLAGSLLFGVTPRAQDAKQPAQAAQQPARVNLNVLVLDDKKRPVEGLRQEDFQVFEGDAPQTISFFSKENVPVSYGLVVDSSGSLRKQYKAVLGAAALIVDRSLPGDEGFLVRFIDSSKIEMAQNFTTEKKPLLDMLSSFQVEGGQTAIRDALYVSAEHVAKYKREEDDARRRRALILVTDGEDRASSYSKDDLAKLLRKLNVQVFIIGLIEQLDEEGAFIRRSPREKSRELLEWLAEETGGRVFFPKTFDEMGEAAEEIARDLHSQYVIGYTPTDTRTDKKSYRKVRVKLVPGPGREKLKVITRSGYIAEPPRL